MKLASYDRNDARTPGFFWSDFFVAKQWSAQKIDRKYRLCKVKSTQIGTGFPSVLLGSPSSKGAMTISKKKALRKTFPATLKQIFMNWRHLDILGPIFLGFVKLVTFLADSLIHHHVSPPFGRTSLQFFQARHRTGKSKLWGCYYSLKKKTLTSTISKNTTTAPFFEDEVRSHQGHPPENERMSPELFVQK